MIESYILILSIQVFLVGGAAGAGGIDHIENLSLDQCSRIGQEWVEHQARNTRASKSEVTFLCVKE